MSKSVLCTAIRTAAILFLAAGPVMADVSMSADPASAPASATVEVVVHFTDVADAPTTILAKLTFDPAVCTPLGGALHGPSVATGGRFEFNVVDNQFLFLLYGLGGPAFGLGDSVSLYFEIAPAASGAITITGSGGSASNGNLDDLALNFGDVTIGVLPAQGGYHDADVNHDWGVALTELLRIIQFYNSGGFHCQAGTEDGFAPGAGGDISCGPHDSDYNTQDWNIALTELLRCIQFYNFVGNSYHPADTATEDGFLPGPF